MTIVTVVFNGEAYLEDTIKSVLGQSYNNVEYIIVDGGSKDRTLDIIRKYDAKIDYWVSEPDAGIYDAMNKGLALARGDLIGILNADDWYERTAIEKVVQTSGRENGAIIHGGMDYWDSAGFAYRMRSEETAKENLVRMIENHPAMFVPASVYKQVGDYDVSYKSIADWDFVIRCHKSGVKFVWIDQVLTNFRLGGESSRLSFSRLREKHRLRSKNGTRLSALYSLVELAKWLAAKTLRFFGLRDAYRYLKKNFKRASL